MAETSARTAERAWRKTRQEGQPAAAVTAEIARPSLTEDDIKAMVEARLQAAVDQAMQSPATKASCGWMSHRPTHRFGTTSF
ncbi:MAG: hypothetical protein WB297_02015 [Actinomycetota bacterium]